MSDEKSSSFIDISLDINFRVHINLPNNIVDAVVHEPLGR
jgi:hypothetical protein